VEEWRKALVKKGTGEERNWWRKELVCMKPFKFNTLLEVPPSQGKIVSTCKEEICSRGR
jgi:hypothetical protein